eukprot:7470597-Pyramimonas_sp.AAC.1
MKLPTHRGGMQLHCQQFRQPNAHAFFLRANIALLCAISGSCSASANSCSFAKSARRDCSNRAESNRGSGTTNICTLVELASRLRSNEI